MKVKVFEAFSGYGSQSNALQKLGVDYEVVATSEIDISAILAYGAMRFNLSDDIDIEDDEIRKFLINKNIGYDFKEEKSKINKLNKDKLHMLYNATVKSKNLGDISIINPQDIPKHDIFTMSSPCQDFSSAGKQEGGMWKCNDCGNEFNPIESMFDEMCPICKSVNITKTRSSLLFECAKNIKYNKPKVILFENVKNLVGNKFIDIFNEWCKWLESQGYNNTWEIVNSLDYGVPQNRERVIMISILGDIKYVFPKKITLNKKLKDLLDVNIDEKYFVNTERATNLLAKIKEDDSIGYIQQRLGGMFDDDKKHQAGSVWNKYGVAPTLDTCQGGLRQVCIVDNNRIRKLTPKEYFRLMGVSDKKFQRIVDIGLSDSQLYKLAGNSIVQQVLENIFSVFFNKNIK